MSVGRQLSYLLGHHLARSVAVFSRSEWHDLVLDTGEGTKLTVLPSPLQSLDARGVIYAAAASGICNPDPAVHVARYDPHDWPYVYNVERYTIFERLETLARRDEILRAGGLMWDGCLDAFARDNVFMAGPYKPRDHWVTDLPQYIREAKAKRRE